MDWLKTLRKYVGHARSRFDAFAVTDHADHAACAELLAAVRQEELHRTGGPRLEESAALDSAVDDLLYAVRDTQSGRIVGSVRQTRVASFAGVEAKRAEYKLHLLPPALIRRSVVHTHLAVLQQHQQTGAAIALFQKIYADLLANGDQLALLSCEPGLYSGYLRLGYRPVGRVHATTAGLRIPMALVLHDKGHLDQSRSPLASVIGTATGTPPPEGVQWFAALIAREGLIHSGVSFYTQADDDPVHAPLTDGMSPEGKAALLHGALEVACRSGDLIIPPGDTGRGIGFVVEGVVQVEAGERVVVMLGEGEVFGELAVVLDTRRTARVVAASEATRVLLLSENCLSRLAPADLSRAWQNLARILGHKLQDQTRR